MTYLINITSLMHYSLIVVIFLICMWLTSKNITPHFRSLPALESIPELVGRCVETGRPLVFTLGYGSLRTADAAVSVAGLAIYEEVLKQSIDKGAEVITIINSADHIPLLRGLTEEAYRSKGKPEEIKPENLIFIGGGQYSQIAATIGIMDAKKAGAFVYPGSVAGGDIPIYGEHAGTIGAMSLAGMTNVAAWPWIVSIFDYSLLGEDVLAAGCILSKNPIMTTTIWGGDFYRYALVGIILVGVIASWMGINVSIFFAS